MRSLVFLFALTPLLSLASPAEIILTQDMVGPMKIEKGEKVSLKFISDKFPGYRVTQEIAYGEAGSFHSFSVSTYEGELLIDFISYIENEDQFEQPKVNLHEVVIYGKNIKDQYGVHPGMPLTELKKLRKDMKFGHGHMDDYYFGNDNIWYVFQIDFSKVSQPEGFQASEYAINSDTAIEIISWPGPLWR